jgi:hypothetical protein
MNALWRMKLRLPTIGSALVGMALTLATTANAAAWSKINGFEGDDAGFWRTENGAGVDFGAGYAFSGANNGWIRGSAPGVFNALAGIFHTPGVNRCKLSFRYRASQAVDNWYVGIYNEATNAQLANWGPISSRGQNCSASYCIYGLTLGPTFDARGARDVRVHIGFWGNGSDQWLQIDEVILGCEN